MAIVETVNFRTKLSDSIIALLVNKLSLQDMNIYGN